MGGRTGRIQLSLRDHLFLLVIGLVLPALVVTSVLLRRIVDDNRDAVQRRLLETARVQARVVDTELSGTIRALEGLAESDLLDSRNFPAFEARARRLQSIQPAWSAVLLNTVDG